MATTELESDLIDDEDTLFPHASKPKIFGKKKFYKHRVGELEKEIESLKTENKRLKRKYHDVRRTVQELYQKYGDHYVMYVQSGDGNVMTVDNDLDTGQVIGMLDTILCRTTSGLEESIKIQAETTEKLQSLKSTMITLETKLSLLESQSSTALNKIDKVRRDSTSVNVSLKQLQELIKIAQNPEPTHEVVMETIDVITNHLLVSSGDVFTTGIHEIPLTAHKLSNMLAIKYGSRHEKKLQMVLTGSDMSTPGLLEDKCFYWLTVWVNEHKDEDDKATTLLRLLQALDEDILRDKEEDIIQRNIHDKRSLSSRSSVTLTPHTCLQRDILSKLSAIQKDNQREFTEFRQLLEDTLAPFKILKETNYFPKEKLKSSMLEDELKLSFDHFK